MTAASEPMQGSRREGGPLAGTVELELTVSAVTEVTPSMRRLTFTAPELAAFTHEPGQDLMFTIPNGDRSVRRRYTIRSHDAGAASLDVDAVLHGHGPAARWFSDAAPGTTVTALGPRGKVILRPDADWHLFVGDDSAVPVTLAFLEALPADARVIAIVEVDGPEHEQPSDRAVEWVHRGGDGLADPAALLARLAATELPDGTGAVYLNGERGVVNALRDQLRERGVDPERIATKAYWVRDEANGDHGEPIPPGGMRGVRRAPG